jgi:hypothetical protein
MPSYRARLAANIRTARTATEDQLITSLINLLETRQGLTDNSQDDTPYYEAVQLWIVAIQRVLDSKERVSR